MVSLLIYSKSSNVNVVKNRKSLPVSYRYHLVNLYEYLKQCIDFFDDTTPFWLTSVIFNTTFIHT